MISVMIVDDHPVYRQGLSLAVERAEGLVLAGQAASIETFDAMTAAARLSINVVLLDLHLPGIEGAEGVAHVVGRGYRVVVISAAGTRDAVIDAIAAGASGYLTKAADTPEIIEAIGVVASGGTYVSPTLASYLLSAAKATTVNSFELTKREREVLSLLAAGETDQDIAEILHIAKTTVHSHLDRIRDKTGARRRAELTTLAHQLGIVDPAGRTKP